MSKFIVTIMFAIMVHMFEGRTDGRAARAAPAAAQMARQKKEEQEQEKSGFL